MNLYEAIFSRRSIRDFKKEALKPEVLGHIMDYANHMQSYKSNIEVDYLLVDNMKGDNKLGGPYRVKAPYYFLLSSELKQDYLINAGFLMQQMILYMTARGIASCYQGALKPELLLRAEMKYDYVIGIAFGYSEQDIYRDQKEAKRISESKSTVYKEEVGEFIKQVVQAALIAPSSMNNQPWRLVVYRNRLHVFCKKRRFFSDVISDLKLIDIGIMLANSVQAAEELWLETSFVRSDSLDKKEWKNNEYIVSLVLKEQVF